MKKAENIILSIYERYNPDKLHTVPELLNKYEGQEDDLIENIFNKYNVSDEERKGFLISVEEEISEDYFTENEIEESIYIEKENVIINPEKVILSIYERYNPDKISMVPELLEKYAGQEDDLIDGILSKYDISDEERELLFLTAEQEIIEDVYVENEFEDSIFIENTIINPEKVILSVYERYNPEKISTVPELLEKYSGQEDELIESIFNKYDISDTERDSFLLTAEQEITGNQFEELIIFEKENKIKNPEKVILSIYKRYNPEKISALPELLEKYKGQEDDLIENIFIKYNISEEEREVFLNSNKELSNEEIKESKITEEFIEKQSIVTPPVIIEPEIPIEYEKINISKNIEDNVLESIEKEIVVESVINKKGKSLTFKVLMSLSLILLLTAIVTILLHTNGTINVALLNKFSPTKIEKEVAVAPKVEKKVTLIKKEKPHKKAEKITIDTVSMEKTKLVKEIESPKQLNNSVQVKQPEEIKHVEKVKDVEKVKHSDPIKHAKKLEIQKTVVQEKPIFKNKIKKEVNTFIQSNTNNNFYIIAGSYKTIARAEEAVNKLKLKQFNDAQVVGINQDGNIRICYQTYSTHEEAMKDIPTIRQNVNPTAWIYEKK